MIRSLPMRWPHLPLLATWRRDRRDLGADPEPDGLARPIGVFREPRTGRRAIVRHVVDRSLGGEDEAASVREFQLTSLEPAPASDGSPTGLRRGALSGHRGGLLSLARRPASL